MSLKRIFWSLLAGVSLALAGCDDDGGPDPVMYGPPPDASLDQGGDTNDEEGSEDAAMEDMVVSEEELATLYGPVPEYGPPAP